MIPLPLAPKVIQKKDNKAVFEIEALYPGYGSTIGNSLRRVLLSSLEGAAVTQVKIKGVSHEFSTIPGVLEDMIVIILNLKKLRFKIFTDEPQMATVNIKGEKTVKGSDLKLSPQIELVSHNAHIATLTKLSAVFNMEIQIEKGVGYVPVEGREEKKVEIGVMPIDAIFTPVKKVSFSVENMRVGKRTDFDRLKIEIETDGTISPEQALKRSLDILLNHFSLFSKEIGKIEETKKTKKKAKVESKKENEDVKKMKIQELKLSERTKNAMDNNNIKTLSGILKKTEKDLLILDGVGETVVKEIKKVLKKLGLELKE